MQVVDRATVAASVSWSDALDAARRAFRALADGAVDQPDQFEMRPDRGGELHIKGAYLRGSAVLCFKVATGGFPGADPTGFTVVLDAATGAPRWLLADDGLLTEMRTAAAGALATATLARPDARRLLVVGSGGQARVQIHAHLEALPHLQVAVWGRDRARTVTLAADVGAEPADDLAAAVAASDIVVTATSSRRPLIHAAWERPGTHLTSVGSDTTGKQELAADLLLEALHAARDGGVIDAQLLGGIHQALAAGEFEKDPEVVPVQHVVSMSASPAMCINAKAFCLCGYCIDKYAHAE